MKSSRASEKKVSGSLRRLAPWTRDLRGSPASGWTATGRFDTRRTKTTRAMTYRPSYWSYHHSGYCDASSVGS